MKLTISTYSYSRKTHSIKKALDIAKSQGFEAVEIVDAYKLNILKKSYYRSVKAKADKLGLTLSSYIFGANLATPANRGAEEARIKSQIDIAALLGVHIIRHDVLPWTADDETFGKNYDNIIASEQRIADYAAGYDITVTVENHGLHLQQIADLKALVEGVNRPNFRLLGDMGNYLCGDVAPDQAFEALSPYYAHVHAKDFYFAPKEGKQPRGYFKTHDGNYLCGSVIGDGVVPVEKCLEILRSVNYDGYLAIEYEGTMDPIEGVAASAKFLKGLL